MIIPELREHNVEGGNIQNVWVKCWVRDGCIKTKRSLFFDVGHGRFIGEISQGWAMTLSQVG